jgi:glycosyltransferase involved in cell wall biosynthesis
MYCDGNAAFAARGRPYSSVAALSERSLNAVIARERKVYEKATAIFTFSEILRRSFIEDFGMPSERVRTVYGGSNLPHTPDDTVLHAPKNGPPTVLFVGRAFERKGGPQLLAAFRLVRSRIPDARLLIAGASPDVSGMEGVETVGYVDPTRQGSGSLSELYARADLFCMPSHYEPFGVVFVEAMLHGLPCVATRAWAMPEIVLDNETGWLTPAGDVHALADVLTAALLDRTRLRRMGATGRRVALGQFTWPKVADAILTSIREHPSDH